ncbi:MAG: glycine cleavage system protein GcvH [Candidatus Bathyarchaeota archaeon]|jgi:glycine cleavage system H protein|nr:glycine cleavage system protein GcvH [Candidatus Bathyarchaeota archaeon]
MTNEIKYDPGCYYTNEHEWAKQSGDVVIIGISDYAQAQLHEIVYVELPKKDANISQGEAIGAVESVKAVSDFYSPVTGTVVEINEALMDGPEKINSDPYGDGWIAKVKPSNWDANVSKLMDAEKYKQHVATLKH